MRRRELEDEQPCVRDDSTECDCPRCRASEEHFWEEQGDGRDELDVEDECPYCDFGCSSCSPLVRGEP